MATPLSETESLMATPPSDTECSICHDAFDHPKILPCIHRLCRKCLVQWLTKGDKASCPICRCNILEESAFSYSKGSGVDAIIDTLPTDLAMMDLLKSQKYLQGDHECVTCDDPKRQALYLCVDCYDKFCADCAKFHSKLSLTRDHKLHNLCELTAKQLARSYQGSCPNHPQRPPEFYCSSHEKVVCLLCSFVDHKACLRSVVKIEVRVEEVRRDMAEFRDKLKKAEESYKELVKKYNDLPQELQHESNDAKTNIDVIFDSLQKALDFRRKSLKAEVDTLADKEEGILVKSKDDNLACQSGIVVKGQFLEEMLTTTADVTLIAMATELKGQATKFETSVCAKMEANLNIILIFDFSTFSSSDIERNISKLGRVNNEKKTTWRVNTALRVTNVDALQENVKVSR